MCAIDIKCFTKFIGCDFRNIDRCNVYVFSRKHESTAKSYEKNFINVFTLYKSIIFKASYDLKQELKLTQREREKGRGNGKKEEENDTKKSLYFHLMPF